MKRLVPRPLWNFVRSTRNEVRFQSALKEFTDNPQKSLSPQSDVLPRLIAGWGNEGWSALSEYLVASLRAVNELDGDTLECGSGLTTVLMGIIAQKNGTRIWTLEHHAQWGDRVGRALKRNNITSVTLCASPLKDYGAYAWYNPPLNAMPDWFALVVCDGPPTDTKDGRFGLLPVMRAKLKAGTVILLDDAIREEEQEIAARWAKELGVEVQMLGSEKPYIRLRL